MKIYILRHGETEWNKTKRLQGATDIPLDENGIRLAHMAGLKMAEEGLVFDACLSSPLHRAYKTAELVLEACQPGSFGLPKTDERIREVDLGPFEGKCLRDDPRFESAGPMAKTFFEHPEDYRAPEGAESYEAIIGRTGDFLRDLAEKYVDFEGKDFNLLVSTHGCASRALLMNIDPVPLENYWRDRVPPNCAVSIARLEDGAWKLIEKDHLYAELS